MNSGDVPFRVSPDEARDAASAVAAHIPQHATLTFKRCGHSRPALSGPSRTVDERCRACLKERGTFRDPAQLDTVILNGQLARQAGRR